MRYLQCWYDIASLFLDADRSFRPFLELDIEDDINPRDFYIEVLLSYRVLFGQDNISHRDFQTWIQHGNPLPKEYHDFLLPLLCSHKWDSSEAFHIWEFIDAEDPSSHYCPTEDFPFLGKRLLELQKYVRNQKANSFWAMWYDNKRNPVEWWTFWVRQKSLVTVRRWRLNSTRLSSLLAVSHSRQPYC